MVRAVSSESFLDFIVLYFMGSKPSWVPMHSAPMALARIALPGKSSLFLHLLHGNGRMGIGCPCPHFRGDPDGFHDFLLARSLAHGHWGVRLDAPGALGHMGHSHGDQLLGLFIQNTFLEDRPAEISPGLNLMWCQFGLLFGQFSFVHIAYLRIEPLYKFRIKFDFQSR